jgi:hypothetical protein
LSRDIFAEFFNFCMSGKHEKAYDLVSKQHTALMCIS